MPNSDDYKSEEFPSWLLMFVGITLVLAALLIPIFLLFALTS